MDPAIILQRHEERLCDCGAAGSGEGHTEWCKAAKFDSVPKHMDAAEALQFLKLK